MERWGWFLAIGDLRPDLSITVLHGIIISFMLFGYLLDMMTCSYHSDQREESHCRSETLHFISLSFHFVQNGKQMRAA